MESNDNESIKNKKYNPIWKFIFTLLLIVNLIFVGLALLIIIMSYINNNSASELQGLALAIFGLFQYFFILAPIDLIAILFYGRPRGKLRVLTYTALILASLPPVVYLVVYLIGLYFVHFIF